MPSEVLRLGIDPRGAVQGARRFQGAAAGATTSAQGLATAVKAAGAAFLAFGAGRGITASIRAAIDWETAMAGVAKTVDETDAVIHALGEEFRALSEQIPVSANELANVGEAAGQLGIETENIRDFTRVMADLGVATNLSATEAATSLARLANVMQTPQDQFDRLGATIVDLGNNLETTEAEITNFAQNMAAAGAIAGVTEADVLAIAGAFSSVGVDAGLGGTAVQKVLNSMAAAAAQGGAELEAFAEVAGQSAEDFAELWEDDASEAFTQFVEGLGDAGTDAFAILEQLGLGNERTVRAFLSVASAGGLLREALDRGSTAWEENLALTKEAERFYETLGNQLQIVRNRAVNAAAAFGNEHLAPALQAAIDNSDALVDALKAVGQSLTLVATAGGIIAIANIAPAIAGATAAFLAMVPAINSVSSALGLLSIAMGPTGWVVAGATAIAGAFFLMNRRAREVNEQLEAQKEAADRAAEGISALGEAAVRTYVTQLGIGVQQAQQRLEEMRRELEEQQELFQGGPGQEDLKRDIEEQEQKVASLERMLVSAAERYTEFGGAAEAASEDAKGGIDNATDALATFLDRADELQRGMELGILNTQEFSEYIGILTDINQRLEDGNLALADRIALQETFNNSLVGGVGFRLPVGQGPRAPDVPTGPVTRRNPLNFDPYPDAPRASGGGFDLREIDQATRGLAALADVSGELDEEARGAVRGISDLIGGFEGLQGGDLGTFGTIGAAAGVFSGAVGIMQSIAGIFENEVSANTRALRDLTGTLSGAQSIARRRLEALDIDDPARQREVLTDTLLAQLTQADPELIAALEELNAEELIPGIQAAVQDIPDALRPLFEGTAAEADAAIVDIINAFIEGGAEAQKIADFLEAAGIGVDEFLDTISEIETLGDAAQDTADAFGDVARILNQPQGFRGALLRWQATDPELRGGDLGDLSSEPLGSVDPNRVTDGSYLPPQLTGDTRRMADALDELVMLMREGRRIEVGVNERSLFTVIEDYARDSDDLGVLSPLTTRSTVG